MAGLKILKSLSKFNSGTKIGVYLFSLLLVIYLFEFKSELPEKIEDQFYSLRTRHKPALLSEPQVVSIKVSSTDLQPSSLDLIKNGQIPFSAMNAVVTEIKKASPKNIIVVFPPNTAPYEDQKFKSWLGSLNATNITPFIGVMNSLDSEDGYKNLTKGLKQKVFSASLALSASKNSIVTSFPIFKFNNIELEPMIVTASSLRMSNENLAEILQSKSKAFLKEIETNKKTYGNDSADAPILRLNLNYRHEKHSASMAFADLQDSKDLIKDKLVIVGFDFSKIEDFSKSIKTTRETYYSNTPWSKSYAEPTSQTGAFYSEIIAQAVDNLVNNDFLRKHSTPNSVFLISFFVLLSFFAWRFPMEKAAILLIAIHSVYYIYNLISFSYLASYPEMGRVAFYSALSTFIGAFIQSQRSLENRLSIELRTNYQKELSSIHNKFLNVLSKGFMDQSKKIADSIRELIAKAPETPPETINLLDNAANGAVELSEYLLGLSEYSKIESNSIKKPEIEKLNLSALLISAIKQCHPEKKELRPQLT